tara:strand:+ start:187 stop:468 length:282 start_codon:yes stop_codon:yes gene_type:complete
LAAFIERWYRKGQPEQTAPLAKSGSNSKKERRQQVLPVDAEVIVTTQNASKAQALFKKTTPASTSVAQGKKGFCASSLDVRVFNWQPSSWQQT